MALNKPLSASGFEADITALRNTYEALHFQSDVLRTLYQAHTAGSFLPDFIVEDVRKAAFVKSLNREIIETLILVGIIGAFQKFVKVLVSDVLNTLRVKNASFTTLDETFRNRYLAAAAATFRFKPDGTVKGVRINFATIQDSLAKCLVDDADYTLEGEAITSEMGNPTPNTVDGIFDKIGMNSPFDTAYGDYLLKNGWSGDKTSGQAIRSSQATIVTNVQRRNDAVHGLEKVVFYQGEIADLCGQFESIGMGLFESVNSRV